MASKSKHLPLPRDVAVVRQFLTVAEHKELLDWAETQFAQGRLNANAIGAHRFYSSYEEGGTVPALFWEIRRRAISTFSVQRYEDEPEFKCFLGCNTEGGFVHRHRDAAPPGKFHVRMNIMLSKPLVGGLPIINGNIINIEERDLWCFYPSQLSHESSPVQGERKRFVVSIGILVPRHHSLLSRALRSAMRGIGPILHKARLAAR